MKSFSYTVKDELGIHARPADQTVTITVEGADEDAAYDALKSFFETNL